MKGLFIIIIYLCINLVVAVDYDPIEETLQSIDNQLVQEDENKYETDNIFPRSLNIECLQSAVSTLKETAKKLEDDINQLEQYINSESAASESSSQGPENCESESSSSLNSTSMQVPIPMEAYGYANANETVSKECGCNENEKDKENEKEKDKDKEKLKAWDKQISVCKEILHNNNKNLMAMISDLYPEGHKRYLKLNTQHRKGKSNHGKRSGTVWSEWTNWSPCSVSCGAGQQVRFRKCIGPGCNADLELDERRCFQPMCSPTFQKTMNNFQSLFEKL